MKPYVAREDGPRARRVAISSEGDVGVDVKYGVTPGLTLDVTVNPDFAQVEADEQQVNLTQFSQFFPEKREFFLENSGMFYVGDAARNNRVSTAPTPDEDLLLFFSRRIGLTSAGLAVTIPAGVRLSGSAAGFGIGAVSMQTRSVDSTSGANFSVLRVRRNVGRGSDVGVLFMNHSPNDSTGDYNRLVGADATIRFAGRVDWNTYGVRSFAPNDSQAQYAARSSVNYEGNFVHVKPAVLEIGRGFRDDLGYYRRTDVRKWALDMGIRPRLASLRALGVREMHPHMVWAYYERPGDREMIAKNLHTGYTFFLTNGGYVELSANPRFERIETPFAPDESVPAIAPGGYGWTEWQLPRQHGREPSGVERLHVRERRVLDGHAALGERVGDGAPNVAATIVGRHEPHGGEARGSGGSSLRGVVVHGADELLVHDGGVRGCAHAVRSAHEAAERERAAQRDSSPVE